MGGPDLTSGCGVVIFTEKKAPAARWRLATGLVKSWVVIFTEKKAPAASRRLATGLVRPSHVRGTPVWGRGGGSGGADQGQRAWNKKTHTWLALVRQ